MMGFSLKTYKVHQSVGFCEVGIRQLIGKLNGVWGDAVLLERRSQIVGIY